MDPKTLAEQISQGHTTALAQGITLLESQKPSDWENVKVLLKNIKPPGTSSFRLGFSGPPGVGKSSFIEKLGLQIIDDGNKVAVLAIDPSSEITGGSILGDKTRMEELSKSPQSFVRPSPTRGHLGGVTSSLPGVIRLCETAGFNWVLIESVGVGQSEVELSKMVDHFTMISQPGAGDELQGIKKGILEYVDLIFVNKEDRDPNLVNTTKQQYLAALKIMRGTSVPVLSGSAFTGLGVTETYQTYLKYFVDHDFDQRSGMDVVWYESLLHSEFKKRLQQQGGNLNNTFSGLKNKISQGDLAPVEAVDLFFKSILK